MPQKEGINTPLVVTLAAVTCAFLVVTVFAVEAVYNWAVQTEQEQMWAGEGEENKDMVDRTAADARARQTLAIQTERPAEHKIAIDKAMQMIADNGGKVTWKTN